MCGICGFYNTNFSKPEKNDILADMLATIRHRGPDDFGIYIDDNIALGFRRLSIIDLALGHQPMSNEDGTLWLTFNGEIYNYLELRSHLIARGHQMSTSTDSEVILHLFEEYGEGCVSYLRGMFAFVLWNVTTKTLFGARDRFGIKPFYYSFGENSFIYGSEAKSLLKHPLVKREVNLDSVQHYFTFQYVPDPDTLFKDIKRLPPAHYFVYNGTEMRLERYWHLHFKPEMKPLEHFVMGTRHLLTEAVKMHMMSDVARGAFLSSGVDSSIIAALLRKMEKLKT
ncbi:MAG: asparagine synthase (glutamine-hydrolyzing), partial [bacterium]|nr:asparagine synthase (glutamine-hydrolyzing) [bacterium]